MSNENEEVTTKRALSRRILLRGAGVAMTLPWLESAAVWGAPLASKQATPTPPKRFVVQFMGTGISPNNWGAKGDRKSVV